MSKGPKNITRKIRHRETVKLIATGNKLEGKVSLEIRRGLDKLGIKSYKMSDRYRAGIPDIYFPSGNWIETKVVPRLPSREIGPLRYFSGPQRTEMNDREAAGDQCFAAIYFSFDWYHRAFVLCPWYEFWRIALWDLEAITTLGVVIPDHNAPDYQLGRFFNKDHPLKFDPNIWWNQAFDTWVRKNPDKFDPDRRPGRLPASTKDWVIPDDTSEDTSEAEGDDDFDDITEDSGLA